MKPTKSYRSAFLFTAASLFSWGISYSQLIIEVDPTTPIPSTHNQVFNTEWNTDDNKESWTANNQFTFAAGTPTGGVLTGTVTPTGNDPNISLNFGANLVPTSPNTIIEFRIQKQTTDNSRIDIFWADNNGGINAARMVTINPPSTTTDGAFHTYRITFDGQIAGPLSMIRFDIASDVTANGKTVSVDYFRIYTQPSTNPNLRSWDPNATGGTALGGSGTWDTSSDFWFNGAQTFWPDPTASTGMQEADFAGAGGTVDIIPTGVTASNVEFFANGYTLTGGPLTIDGSFPTIRTLIDVNNTVIESQLIASSSLSLAGTGGIVLRADNTLLTVPINASINRLGIAHDGALGSGAVSLQNFVIALDGDRTIANDVAFTSARLIIENNAMGTGLVVGDLTVNGNFALSSSSAPSDFFLRKNLTINGIVSGNNGGRGMIFGGDSGILTLSNSSNSFTGNIFWQAPIVLAVASDEALGGSANTLNFSAAGATANGTLRLLADFDSNRNILINNQQLATANLVTGQIDTNGFNSTWTGKISPTSTTQPTVAAQGGFTKLGLGRLTLSPSSPNTYTGPTTVNAGVLELMVDPRFLIKEGST
ncbi:MAG: hypothetical protein HC767_04920 [Akkermansiaceae bacterium]|nr:hypothetical protein [Akkermansiaceae bacterium]